MQKTTRALIVCLILCFLSPLYVVAQTAPTTPMTSGLSELQAGHYSQALSFFVQHLKAHPSDIQARYCAGVALQYMGRLTEAAHQYEIVVKSATDENLVRRARKGLAGCANAVPITAVTTPDATVASTPSGVADNTGAEDPSGLSAGPGIVGVMSRAAGRASESIIANTTPTAAAPAGPMILSGGRVVNVYADWCGPCKRFAPIFEQVSTKYGTSITFERLNTDAPENKAFNEKWQIHSIPTTLLFNSSGELVDRFGTVTFEVFEKRLQQAFTH